MTCRACSMAQRTIGASRLPPRKPRLSRQTLRRKVSSANSKSLAKAVSDGAWQMKMEAVAITGGSGTSDEVT